MAGRPQALSDEEFLEKFLPLREEGLAYWEIADEIGICPATISKYACRLLGPTEHIKKNFEKELFIEKYEYAKNKYPEANIKTLANAMGFSTSYVYNMLKRMGKPQKRTNMYGITEKQFKQAEENGIGRDSVYQRCTKGWSIDDAISKKVVRRIRKKQFDAV